MVRRCGCRNSEGCQDESEHLQCAAARENNGKVNCRCPTGKHLYKTFSGESYAAKRRKNDGIPERKHVPKSIVRAVRFCKSQ